jgi:hypothetical protein|tara:strand:+ start:311 stop:661 length:351 start_codon:yes stop_codon:yes gene_type:complete
MGYRSEVLLIVGKEAMPLFLTALAREPKARDLCFNYRDQYEKDYEEVGSMLFNWTEIKWYDNYPDIQAIESFMDNCDTEDLDEHYRFVRIGEDDRDIEERGQFAEYEACVNRAIQW